MFHSITEADQHDHIAHNIVAREREVFSYQLNIKNYQLALTTLPTDEWPEAITQYQITDDATLFSLPDDLHAMVATYRHRDRLRYLLRTEAIELNKSQGILDALLTHIPAEKIPDLIAKAKAKIEAVK